MNSKCENFHHRYPTESNARGHSLKGALNPEIMDRAKIGQRMLVVELRKKGKTSAEIQQEFGYPSSFTDRWWGRYVRGEGFEDLPRGGRPQKLPKAVIQKMKHKLKRKFGGSSRKVAAELLKETGISVAHSTILRAAAKSGMKFRIRRKKPRLSETHKARRVAFASQDRDEGFWRQVFTTDEKTFGVHYENRGQWLEAQEEPEPRGTEKYGIGVRVWGGVGFRGLTPLYRIPKSMTGNEYKMFLEKKVFPDMEAKYGKNWIFQHDGDGSHAAAVVRSFLDQQEEDWIDDWPSLSPDISPIENLWAILGQRLVGCKASTTEGLWLALKREWDSIDNETCQRLGDSIPNRLQLVISANGRAIRY